MSSLSINLSDADDSPHFLEALSALQRGLVKFGIKSVLIGARARDISLFKIHNLKPKDDLRTTRDIDFAILVDEIVLFEALVNDLVQEEGFSRTANKFTLTYQGIQIDLCPFGGITEEIDYEQWATGSIEAAPPSTLGLLEALGNALTVKVDDMPALTIQVVSLEILTLLKIIAWNDRPEHRTKDAQDICVILQECYEVYRDEDFFEHLDLLDEYPTDEELTEKAGCRILGRNIAKILIEHDNSSLLEYLISILVQQINNQNSRLILAMGKPEEQDKHLNRLKALLHGLKDRKLA